MPVTAPHTHPRRAAPHEAAVGPPPPPARGERVLCRLVDGRRRVTVTTARVVVRDGGRTAELALGSIVAVEEYTGPLQQDVRVCAAGGECLGWRCETKDQVHRLAGLFRGAVAAQSGAHA